MTDWPIITLPGTPAATRSPASGPFSLSVSLEATYPRVIRTLFSHFSFRPYERTFAFSGLRSPGYPQALHG